MKASVKQTIIRNIIFGVQDSFGSTVGFLSGIAVSGVIKETLLTSGIILVIVEAFSMGIGSIISDHTVEEVKTKRSLPLKGSAFGGVYMFFAYVIAGMVPLLPYYFMWGPYAILWSIGMTTFFVGLLGYISGRMLGLSPIHHTKEMLFVGLVAIIAGVTVGKLLPSA